MTLPTENATLRMRAWRSLKASGAAVLRDGVYLLPEDDNGHEVLASVAGEVQKGGGTAWVLRLEEPEGPGFAHLFDRTGDFATLLPEVAALLAGLGTDTAHETAKTARKLRKRLGAVMAIDFFPGEAQKQVVAALDALDLAVGRAQSPDEPTMADGTVPRQEMAAFQGRTWATRRRPKVDRLASAWLIRRFIDPAATFRWLARPSDCPKSAVGFDFDGATFSHVGHQVTFEVLIRAFGLTQPALQRMGALVHYLDVGGVPVPEAAGLDSVLAGLLGAFDDDDQLLRAACVVWDGLYATFDAAGSLS